MTLTEVIDGILTLANGRQPLAPEEVQQLESLDLEFKVLRIKAGLPGIEPDVPCFCDQLPRFGDCRVYYTGPIPFTLRPTPEWQHEMRGLKALSVATAGTTAATESAAGPRRPGRRRTTDWDKDNELVADWEQAKGAGTPKKVFAKGKVKQLNRVLNRVQKRVQKRKK